MFVLGKPLIPTNPGVQRNTTGNNAHLTPVLWRRFNITVELMPIG